MADFTTTSFSVLAIANGVAIHTTCCIDNVAFAGREGAAKVRLVLRMLVDQWCSSIDKLQHGGVCYLPFDFSDQSTRWLRCTLEGDEIVFQPGWSHIEGWSFSPSDAGELLTDVHDFEPDGSSVSIRRDDLLTSLSNVTHGAR